MPATRDGHNTFAMLVLSVLFPALLLLLALAMERVEAPLRFADLGQRLDAFLDSARPEEVETLISEGLAPALDRYWRRRTPHRLRRRAS